MKYSRIITFLIISLLFSSPVAASALTKSAGYQDFSAWYMQRNNIEALPYVSAAIIESESYTPLHYHAEQRVIPTASLVKLVTAGALRIYPTDWSEEVSFTAADNYSDFSEWIEPTDAIALLRLEDGETVTREQAFATMLIGSANNAANGLPKKVSYNREEFASVMNFVAQDWGMKNTSLVEPTGLSLDNLSTAQDMVLGTCKALEDDMIRKYAGFSYYKFNTSTDREKIISHTVYSLRQDLDYSIYYGAKTGFLNETGYHISAGLNTPSGKQICATVLSGGDRREIEDVVIQMREWVDQMYR